MGKILKKELTLKYDAKFRTETDTEVLLELISLVGLKKTLERLEGMIAFALWDKKNNSFHLVRDRFGEKPLFYFLDNDYFVFSSELKSIKKFFQKSYLQINGLSCNLFSCLGYIPAPLTIYKKTFKVLPSEIITIKDFKIISCKKCFFTSFLL